MASDPDVGPDVDLFESWVRKNYGGNSRTKTITKEKYVRICNLIRGEDPNSNAKFRFWVRNKGFRLLRHDKNTDEILDDPNGSLFVSLHAKEDNTPMGEQSIEKFLRTNLPAISFFRKVAIVEDFYGIIKCAHVDDKGVHAGQKKTYRLVSDTYAFLPREVITFFLLNCDTCKPRIQKYGPIPSKLKSSNIRASKNKSESNSSVDSNNEDIYKRVNLSPHQVLRPSPKRYRPTFIENELSYIHNSNGHGAEMEILPQSDAPSLYKYDGVSIPGPNNNPFFQNNIYHGIAKNLQYQPRQELLIDNSKTKIEENHLTYPVAVAGNHRDRNIDIIKMNQDYTHPNRVDRLVRKEKEFHDSFLQNGAEKLIKDDMDLQRYAHTHKNEFLQQRRNSQQNLGALLRCPDSIANASSYQCLYKQRHFLKQENEHSRRICEYRVHPYNISNRHESCVGCRRNVAQAQYLQSPRMNYQRLPEDVCKEVKTYCDMKEPEKYPATHKTVVYDKAADVQGNGFQYWSNSPKFMFNNSVTHRDILKSRIESSSKENLREKLFLHYKQNEDSKQVNGCERNKVCALRHYHKLVCEAVTSSLLSLCHPSKRSHEVEENGTIHQLKVPDPSKVCQFIQDEENEDIDILDSDSGDK